MRTSYKLVLICLGALLLRAGLAVFVRHPGIADPNHYYNLGRALAEGRGFTVDYIWQYYNPPDDVVHPDDFWAPLTGVIAATGMVMFGIKVHAALLPFILLGALLPVVVYAAARQLDLSAAAGLFAAALSAVLPEFVLNSVRTNTLIPHTLLAGLCILLLVRGLQRHQLGALVGAGVLGGLAYLNRTESSFFAPMLVFTWLAWLLFSDRVRLAQAWHIPLVAGIGVLVAVPWLIRNVHELGAPVTPNLDRIFYMTDVREFYTYGRDLNWDTLRAAQSPSQIIAKRLFEMAASLKTIYTALDVVLPVAVIGGLILLALRRDRSRLLVLAPTLILLAGNYFFYTLLAPYNNQGGAFKKAYLSLVPLLIPVGAYAFEQAITDRRLRHGAMALTLVLMTGNAVELTRADLRLTNSYLREMEKVVDVVEALPDTNGDGQIVLMAQDQFMLSYLGIPSVAIPMEDRPVILEVARRYRADYLMMPPGRPSLDALFNGEETDPRFVPVAEVPGTIVVIYGFNFIPAPGVSGIGMP